MAPWHTSYTDRCTSARCCPLTTATRSGSYKKEQDDSRKNPPLGSIPGTLSRRITGTKRLSGYLVRPSRKTPQRETGLLTNRNSHQIGSGATNHNLAMLGITRVQLPPHTITESN